MSIPSALTQIVEFRIWTISFADISFAECLSVELEIFDTSFITNVFFSF